MRREECKWKKHCASYECETCQEGSEFRIVVPSKKRQVEKTFLEREQPARLREG